MRGRRLFSRVYFTLFCAQASHFIFINIYYLHHGLKGRQLGLLSLLGPVLVVLTQPFWGLVSDSLRDKRIPLLIMLAVCGSGYLALLGPPSFSRYILVTVMMAVFYGPVIPLLDSRTASFLGPEKQQSRYGGIRLWGSWGFLAGALITGKACDLFGEKSFIVLYAFFCWAAFFVFLTLPRRGTVLTQRSWRHVPRVLSNRKFSLFLGLSILSSIAGSTAFPFMTPFFSDLGMSKTMLGFVTIPAILSEVAAFGLARKILPRIGPVGGVSLGLVFSALRWVLLSLVRVPAWAFAVHFIHGWAFGLFHSGTQAFISRESPPELRATAQTLFMALTMGLAVGLGGFIGGHIYDAFGPRTLFQISSASLLCCAFLQWMALGDRPRV